MSQFIANRPEARPSELELTPIPVPATSAGAMYQGTDFQAAVGGMGKRYVRLMVYNGSATRVVLTDAGGRTFPVQGGQPMEWVIPGGTTWWGLTPDADISATDVLVVPTVRIHASG